VARWSQDDLHPTMVRLPEGLRRELEQWATLHGRSLNAEIIYLLEQSLADAKVRRGGRLEPSLSDRLEKIEKILSSFRGLMKAQQNVAQDALTALKRREPKDESK